MDIIIIIHLNITIKLRAMFKLEKVFQNDDSFFINISFFFQIISVFISIYIFSIIEFNTIYDLFDINIYINSIYYNISIILVPIYYLSLIFLNNKKKYKHNFTSFIVQHILPLIISTILCFMIILKLEKNFYLSLSFFYLILFIFLNLYFIKIIMNFIYNYLIEKNIIQRNIMLVGDFNDILKISKEYRDKINIYKCCLLIKNDESDLKKLRMNLKIPIFTQKADVRSILEYHSLGQIWVLDNKKNDLNKLLSKVLKYSVDIVIVDIKSRVTSFDGNLINNKYSFIQQQVSKFHGYKLFIKIVSDKILSTLLLICLSPIILISMFFIYLEDGFPLFSIQDRLGWDGRRFKIYKLRSLKNKKIDKQSPALLNENHYLKSGKLIEKLNIDELPQFYNVLKGEMSIVGPRPHLVDQDILYSRLFNNFLKRHKSNPGITGWAQVNNLRGVIRTPLEMRNRMEYDLWYLNHWTLWLDYYIILRTFYAVFKNNDQKKQ